MWITRLGPVTRFYNEFLSKPFGMNSAVVDWCWFPSLSINSQKSYNLQLKRWINRYSHQKKKQQDKRDWQACWFMLVPVLAWWLTVLNFQIWNVPKKSFDKLWTFDTCNLTREENSGLTRVCVGQLSNLTFFVFQSIIIWEKLITVICKHFLEIEI